MPYSLKERVLCNKDLIISTQYFRTKQDFHNEVKLQNMITLYTLGTNTSTYLNQNKMENIRDD